MAPAPSTVGGHYSTPLHAVLDLGFPLDAVIWLMERSPRSLLAFNVAGRIPLSVAILRSSRDIAKAVFEKTKSLHPGSDRSYDWIFSLQDHQGLTLLHYAVMSGSFEMVLSILSWFKGDLEDPDGVLRFLISAVDVDGWTPLHWACRRGSNEIVKILLDNNASIEATTYEGWTPRQVAIIHGFEDFEYIKSLSITNDRAATNDDFRLPDNYQRRDSGYCDVCYTVRRVLLLVAKILTDFDQNLGPPLDVLPLPK
ncbi:hypothetical protein O1611_g7546 [Lasiodiplodia mahajangana]|uniref:Uncharacterized protein n=1 Tax=Lasiodiplodia mahajangana TaxID=1108764 RepID=A0ACC2JFC3_9PEZI|nr:hypothetical protein O1611_g7546 [Lasiodiplodia mahajangana]